jgi:ketosteroid isomerase-like protein
MADHPGKLGRRARRWRMFNVVDAMVSIGTFEQFVAAINAHDMEALTSLMTQDHLFVDAMGNRVQGAQSMHAGWRGYLRCVRTIGSKSGIRYPNEIRY